MSRYLLCPDSWYIEGIDGSLNIHYLNVSGSLPSPTPPDFTEIFQTELGMMVELDGLVFLRNQVVIEAPVD